MTKSPDDNSSYKLMGIVNVTPDSFSDGGKYLEPQKAVEHGLRLMEEGADILDIGGESTRPGSTPVPPEEEQKRILPVIEELAKKGAFISVDTRNADTMKKAIDAGAAMINDVTALTHDTDSMKIAVESGAYICLMHMRGTPANMQQEPHYNNVVKDVYNYLANRVSSCKKAGIPVDKIIIDPGIGFGKTLEHNLLLLKNLPEFKRLGAKLMIGTSRKSFIEGICKSAGMGNTAPEDRLPGSIASVIWGLQNGATIFRVHDVRETKQAIEVFAAISNNTRPGY